MSASAPPVALPGPERAWAPRPYPQLLRGPRHRWWRPLLGLAVVLGCVLVLAVLSVVLFGVAALVSGAGFDEEALGASWQGFLANDLLLAALVPVAWLAVLAGHGVGPRWVASVTGGVRWRWLLLSALVPLVVLLVSIVGLDLLSGGGGFGSGPRPATGEVVALLLVVALTTPLQAAGEEYFFRGWVSLAVGSLFARPALGAVVAALVSASLFGLAHGQQDPWLFADRFCFGLCASYLAWRTGGLETGIAFHTLNNVIVFVPTVLAGGLGEALTTTGASPVLVVVDLVGFALIAAATAWLARRRGLVRLSVPPRVESSVVAAGQDPER